MEIEKKYLINNLLYVAGVSCSRIEQHYICLSKDREVRIRKKGDEHFLTIKGDGALIRNEWEQKISQEAYEYLLPASIGSIIKDRYEVNLPNEKVAEVDIYRGDLEGPNHITVEVEFGSKEEADIFEEPIWFGKDITNDARYKNRSLAINGWP